MEWTQHQQYGSSAPWNEGDTLWDAPGTYRFNGYWMEQLPLSTDHASGSQQPYQQEFNAQEGAFIPPEPSFEEFSGDQTLDSEKNSMKHEEQPFSNTFTQTSSSTEAPNRKKRRRKKNKPPEKNIVACRAYREREKRKRQELEESNERLEAERMMYLRRITELQQQAMLLRNGGEVDLNVENELLRSEIRKHKSFVQELLAVACQKCPDKAEKGKVLRQGIDAGVGQTIGLAITSARDPDWQTACPINVGGYMLPVKYIYLPSNVPREQATRLNVRIELRSFPMTMEVFNERVLCLYSNTKHLSQLYESYRAELGYSRAVQQVYPEKDEAEENSDKPEFLPDVEDIRVIRLVSTDESGEMNIETDMQEFEALYINAYKKTAIHPSALWVDMQSRQTAEDALVSVQTSSSSKVLYPDANDDDDRASEVSGRSLLRLESQQLLGTIVQNSAGSPGHCDAVVVASFPIGDKEYVGIAGRQVPNFDENGKMDKVYEEKIDRQFRMVFLPHLK